MNTPSLTFKNEQGSTIIVAMLILVFLTIIGISATNTSIFESQIVGNEHRYQIDFYLADRDLDVLHPGNNSLSQYGIPYWYQAQHLGDSVVVGSDKSYRKFSFSVASNANQTQEIEVMASKIYKVGY
jgi:hypothetical protein